MYKYNRWRFDLKGPSRHKRAGRLLKYETRIIVNRCKNGLNITGNVLGNTNDITLRECTFRVCKL